jgi:hypothetical protein
MNPGISGSGCAVHDDRIDRARWTGGCTHTLLFSHWSPTLDIIGMFCNILA